MCGISGIISGSKKDTNYNPSILQHRGPDNEGQWLSTNGNAALYHNRLSIIDLSDEGNQPMMSNDKRFAVVYNGELYNYLELRNELKGFYEFQTVSDTEVVLAAYKKWGVDCLPRFVGMFSFAIWDNIDKELFAAVDRFGVKPFYYNVSNEGFRFASEIKALHKMGISKELNESIWATYFAKGIYDHSEHTFWNNISRLEGGHYLTYSSGKGLNKRKWYDAIDIINDVDDRSETEIQDELLSLMEKSIEYRFVSDVPVGVCLSGGLDSSLLVALIRRVKGNDFPLKSFTFYTNDVQYDEVKYVKELAKIYKFDDHYFLYLP